MRKVVGGALLAALFLALCVLGSEWGCFVSFGDCLCVSGPVSPCSWASGGEVWYGRIASR